ncbi:MAG TPA: hypothetical protein VHV32_19175 [Candidatus Angelobacter sp.]|jgi:hypothetical protein|nr:hypothetical protein [Candidatus Angelobacter sp.]
MTPNPSTPEATRAPFELPLQGGDYGDDILDDAGQLVLNLYGDERAKETRAQRDYVVRAVNSYDDMLSALKHQLFRNHEFSYACDECAAGMKVIEKAGAQ